MGHYLSMGHKLIMGHQRQIQGSSPGGQDPFLFNDTPTTVAIYIEGFYPVKDKF